MCIQSTVGLGMHMTISGENKVPFWIDYKSATKKFSYPVNTLSFYNGRFIPSTFFLSNRIIESDYIFRVDQPWNCIQTMVVWLIVGQSFLSKINILGTACVFVWSRIGALLSAFQGPRLARWYHIKCLRCFLFLGFYWLIHWHSSLLSIFGSWIFIPSHVCPAIRIISSLSILLATLIIESVARVSQHVLFTHELLVKQV